MRCGMSEHRADELRHDIRKDDEVGCREKLGQLNGVWRDVLLLERRSHIVGV